MFHQHLNEQATGPVSLKGPSGNKWQAVLASESEAAVLRAGMEGICHGSRKDFELKTFL
jgi:hypothetical protein